MTPVIPSQKITLKILIILSVTFLSFSIDEGGNALAPTKLVLHRDILNIYYGVDGDDYHLIIEKTGPGHAVVGFGKSMNKANVIQCEKVVGAGLKCNYCKLSGYSAPVCQAENAWTTIASVSTANRFKIHLYRNLQDQNPTDYVIKKNGKNTFIWSHTTSDTVEFHGAGTSTNRGYGITNRTNLILNCQLLLVIFVMLSIY